MAPSGEAAWLPLPELGRRICILGPSNSGKSTLAEAIARKCGLAVVHLDQLHHLPHTDWQPRPPGEFLALHDEAIRGDAWVMDGNYSGCMPQRFRRATGVILLDIPTPLSLFRYVNRCLSGRTRAGGLMLHDRLTRGRVMSQPVERFGVITGMIETAENLARDYGISREQADAYAVRSHQRAAAAWKNGLFDDELVPVPVPQRKGDPVIFAHDEGYRADASMETLGALKAIDGKTIPGAIVTAGNASQQNDAAAACLIVAEDKLEELGLEPIAWFHSAASAGCDPARMGIGPVPAVERLFARNGLGWSDIDLVELNEAFAPQVLACLKGWGWSADDSRNEILNVNGSGISLGHPIGATGGRILANLTRELQRRGGRYGIETMCIGGGQGIAAVFERAA